MAIDVFDVASESLRRFLNQYTTALVIPDYDSNPEPTETYGTVGVSYFSRVGSDQNSFDPLSTDLQETVRREYEVVFDVNYYGAEAGQKAMEASYAFGFQSQRQELFHHWGLGYVRQGDIRRIPELRQTKFTPRYSFDVTCNIVHEVTHNLDWFDSVEYTGIYVRPDDTVLTITAGFVDGTTEGESFTEAVRGYITADGKIYEVK